ncbi:hypothetical protein [Flavobacterium quisquiliarum]|uniref:Uncharacterized protein n=1 Tax=Flavobacterium quisquiliarum TaxID=1834436 RepID=A0ABV8W7S8_9FLAO|nr:hypothetical protein [Flavobacterium quisquiliarum]MBW1655352.1 hypothetical protein [Flavobacterium quisquiliarum]NWL00738.1 hypothetical protein [Flavobacterium collinsii]
MKKTILSTLLLLYCVCINAQLSDADAKILYQQAEDAYNNSNYNEAIAKSKTLYQKMDKWTPKVLYLYLKSSFKNEPDNYKENLELSNLCSEFFKITNKTTYPPEKYKEILEIQAYFKRKTEELAYQKDRTPQDAVNFLNECFKKFPEYPYNDDKIIKIEREISLNENFLCIISKALFHTNYGGSNLYYSKGQTIYLDLSKLWLSKFNVKYDAGLTVAQLLTDGLFEYDGDKKRLIGYISYRKNEDRLDPKEIYSREKNAQKDFDAMILVPSSVAFDNKKSKQLSVFENTLYQPTGYDFISTNFNTSAVEYKEGNYEKRIMEAYKFLLDYFPKKEEKTETTTSKF